MREVIRLLSEKRPAGEVMQLVNREGLTACQIDVDDDGVLCLSSLSEFPVVMDMLEKAGINIDETELAFEVATAQQTEMEQGISYSDILKLEAISVLGNDQSICDAARVSTMTELFSKTDLVKNEGLITTLMTKKHGTPFEHNCIILHVHCPIFVSREWFRHRIGWSYNETSTRYKKMEMKFYIPPISRPMIEPDKFKPMSPVLDPISSEEYADMIEETLATYAQAAATYKTLLKKNCAREVARNVLPLALYTSFYATCNLRSALHFIALRTNRPNAKYQSKPLWEIDVLATRLENILENYFPIALKAFNSAGRVAP